MIFNKELDKKPYVELIRTLVPFDELSTQAQNEIIQMGKVFKYGKRNVVFKQGDRDNFTYYLLEGVIEMLSNREVKSTITGGTDSARYAMARLLPRQFTARAVEDCMVLQLDKAAVDRTIVADKSDSTTITASRHFEVSEIGDEDDAVDWMTKMLQSEIFSQLPTANIQQLFVMLEPLEFKAGNTVIKQGDPGDSYYIIQDGQCEVSRIPSPGSKPVKLADLSPGDSFGEEALLMGGKRNASVIMKTDGILMKLSKENFITLVKIPSMSEVTYDQGKTLVEAGAVWLDVRFKDEFKESSIKGSINIPFNMLRAQLDKLDKNKQYIICCDSGGRSSAAAFTLINNGFNVSVLKGGLASIPSLGSEAEATAPKKEKLTPAKAEAPTLKKDRPAPAKTTRPEPSSKEGKPKRRTQRAPVFESEDNDDPAVRSAVIDADIAKNELKLEDTSHRLAEARDDEDTTDIRRKKQELEDERKKLEIEKKAAEEEARRFKEEEARKIAKLKEETEKRLADEKKKLEEIYSKNTEEMEKLQKMKQEAEEQIRKEREKLEQEAAEAREKLQSADEVKKKLEESHKALEEEASRKREEQANMEKEAQAKAKAKLEAERRTLAEEVAKANAELEEANKKNAMAEAARKAAAEEAKSIIDEYKKQFEEERAKERARLEHEKKQLEKESSKIKEVLNDIERTKREAEAAKAAAALEAQKLRAAQADALDEKARKEAEDQMRMAEYKLRQAEKNLENAHQAKVNVQTAEQIRRQEIEVQQLKNDDLGRQVEEDLAMFMDEQDRLERSASRVISHSEHVKRIKERAEAAKREAENATKNLFSDIESQLDKKD